MLGQLALEQGAQDASNANENDGPIAVGSGTDGGHDWAALYRAYHPIVYHHGAADDAAQEIFTRLIRNRSQVPPGEGTARWLHRVAVNHCLNQLRDERRRRQAATAEEPLAVAHDHVATRDLAGRLLDRMPVELRLAAWLRYACDLELQEIATMLHVSRRTVVTRLATFNARARRMLLTQLQAEPHDV
jgi:RNA polymerase sigma-70 factor (ECF subfamily)